MNDFKEFLIKIYACAEALEWLGERNAEQAWTECIRADWLLWFVERVVDGDDLKKEIVKISLDCAKLSLSITADPRVVDCCNAVERWLAGESVNLESVRAVATTAIESGTPRSVYSIAYAAAYAAEAGAARSSRLAAYTAIRAIVWSAESAACSAPDAEQAARRAASVVRQWECADIVRTYIPWTTIKPLLEQKCKTV